ncbi:MAG: hypothetical protein R6V58_16550 [Planctomycetota bacterium]
MMRNVSLVIVLLALFAPPTPATHAEPEPAPAAPQIHEDKLVESARAALVKAVDFLRARAAEDEEGWIVPPIRTRAVTGYKEVTLRYRRKTFQEPVYEYETFETYERELGDDSVSAKKLKKVKKRRIKRQIGTKPVTRLVRDPKGPIRKTVKQAVWGEGGPDFWGVGKLGHNGLALFAMRKAGVPATDKAVAQLAGNLADFVEDYGAPDSTYDLACVTAALASMPGDYYQKLAKAMAGKLLDGQIATGDAKGLWGPVCINTRLLAAALQYELLLNKIRDKAKAALDEKANPGVQKRFDKAEAALLELQEEIAGRISQCASAIEKIDYRIHLTPEAHDPIRMSGLAHYVFTQTTADVESTALALWALRVVAEKDLLPAKTHRPVVGGRPIAPPRKAAVVLARAARALAAAQRSDGGWTELNRHQPVRDFHKMTSLPGVPVRPIRYPPLASPPTAMSTWQGHKALLAAGHMLGLDRLLDRLGPHVRRGSARARDVAGAMLDAKLDDAQLGARVPPADAAFFLTGISRAFQAAKEDRRDLWLRLAFKLVAGQNNDGSWGRKYPLMFFLPTSLRARIDCEEMKRTPAAPPRALPHTLLGRTEKGEPGWKYHCYGPRSPLRKWKDDRVSTAGHHRLHKLVYSTACSIVFLADGVRRPAAGDCAWSENAGQDDLLAHALAMVKEKTGVPLSYRPVERGLRAVRGAGLPVLLVRGAGEFEPAAETKESLEEYVGAGGLVLVAAAANDEGGAFLDAAEAALKKIVANGKCVKIGDDEALLGELAGKVSLRAVAGADGNPAAVLLPVATGGRVAEGALTGSRAAAVLAELLLRRVPANVLKENYPSALFEPGELVEGLDGE